MNPQKVTIIAEAGVNHNGDRDLAFALIDAAARAGVDAVKFQTFNAERLASRQAPKAAYQRLWTDTQESQKSMLKKLELPPAWHVELQDHARQRGIEFLSTAFDLESLRFLADLKIPIFKVPSGELCNAPLLWRFARYGRPLILSTGMATLSEVEQGLAVVAHAFSFQVEPTSMDDVWRAWSSYDVRRSLIGRVTLLHCTSQYPTPMNEVNLGAMDTLAHAFGLPVGYSDHTEGLLIPIAAVARGASVIEKHFTLDRTMEGPDHRASLEPDEMTTMVGQIRMLTSALGDGSKVPQASEWDTRRAARQQIVAARAIIRGNVLTRDDLTTARCGSGMPAAMLWDQIGRAAEQDYAPGDLFQG